MLVSAGALMEWATAGFLWEHGVNEFIQSKTAGKQKFSKELSTIDKREGYKMILKDEKRKYKPSELLKADKVSNPYIDRTYI
jgi:hypothetical protein